MFRAFARTKLNRPSLLVASAAGIGAGRGRSINIGSHVRRFGGGAGGGRAALAALAVATATTATVVSSIYVYVRDCMIATRSAIELLLGQYIGTYLDDRQKLIGTYSHRPPCFVL